MKRFLSKFFKILLWITGSIILLFLILVLLIQFPTVQNYIKNQAVTFVEGKIKTPVKIDRLEIGLPKKIILSGFYFEDQAQDTLLSGERLAVDISLFKLLRNTVEINSIELEGVVANIKRDQDSVFNFDYIIEAFAPETPDTTAVTPVSIDKINLDRIKFRIDDALTKTGLNLKLKHFDTRIRKFDLENMDFDVPEIAVDGFFVNLNQGLVEEVIRIKDSETKEISEDEIGLKLKLGKIALTNIGFDYSSAEENLNSAITFDKLNLKFNELNLEQELAEIETLNLSGLKGRFIFEKTLTIKDTIAQPPTPNNWKVKMAQVDFSNIEFRFKDENLVRPSGGFDYSDINLTDLNVNTEDFYYSTDTISGRINSFTLQDKSGLYIKSLQTDFLYGSTSTYLKNLYLETPNTILRDKIVLGYPSIESLGEQLGNLEIDANLENSSIGFRDILLLAPNLKETPPFKSYPNAVLNINGKATGKIDNLEIPNLEVTGIGNTSLS
ncbi:MAG: AsmA family protein, partial [Gillisia sp.]|nr:AsmA family protein [Gillisia sp.]